MEQQKLPRPENTRVWLASEGLADRRATRHVYSRTRAVKGEKAAGVGYEFIFTCTETNVARVFGFEGPPEREPELAPFPGTGVVS